MPYLYPHLKIRQRRPLAHCPACQKHDLEDIIEKHFALAAAAKDDEPQAKRKTGSGFGVWGSSTFRVKESCLAGSESCADCHAHGGVGNGLLPSAYSRAPHNAASSPPST